MAGATETRLEQELAARGWSWNRLAQEVGVSRQVMGRWMSGRRAWPRARAEQVAALFGVSFVELFEQGDGR